LPAEDPGIYTSSNELTGRKFADIDRKRRKWI